MSEHLDIRDLGDGRNYRLLSPFLYHNNGIRIVVPAGFKTDFASIPRILWRIVPPMGRHNKAAAVHDWLYRNGCLSRAVADALFLEVMARDGVPRLVRWILYLGVRLGGWAFYQQQRSKLQ